MRGTRRERDGYFLRAESLFNVATEIEQLGDGLADDRTAAVAARQSHGESFMALRSHVPRPGPVHPGRARGGALPEPSARVLVLIHQLVQDGSQFIIATHSPILMAYPNATHLQARRQRHPAVAYEDTEHFTVTRDFLNNYPQMLRVLLEEDGGGES